MKESEIFRNWKPFEYRVYNKEAELEPYSGGFLTEEKALEWYNKHGVWLEEKFKRTLVLIENRNSYQTHFNF
jgi:hypothetical protein